MYLLFSLGAVLNGGLAGSKDIHIFKALLPIVKLPSSKCHPN